MSRDPNVPTPDGGQVPAPPRTPGWTPPPLPGGHVPVTPGGDGTIRSGEGLTSSALVGPACRVPILFGRCRISPDIVAVAPESFRVRFEVVISEGPIDAVEDWRTDPAETFESIDVTLGTLTAPASGLAGTVGLAAANILTKAGKPYQPRCIARGRKLYDPRPVGAAWGSGAYPDPAFCAYSTNPALIMADLLLFPQYGWGLPDVTPALVDWTSVHDAADWCDELVSGEKRYELNLWLQQGESAAAWVETIGLHSGLRWSEAGGLWRLDYSAPVATVAATITDDHVVAGSAPRLSYGSGAGLADRPNVFTAEWIDPASDWQVRTVEIRHPAVDAGEPKRAASVYQFHGFHSEAMALRALWRVACDIWSEQELEVELTTEMLHLVDGSRVTVNLASLGLSAVDFLVTRTSYDADQVRITARRYDTNTWSAPLSTSDPLPGSGFFDTPPALTSLSIVAAETEITASSPTSRTTVKRLGAEWTLPTFAWARRVVVRYWNAYTTTPAWDDAGFEEFFFPLTGTPGLGSDPDWIGSLSPDEYERTVDNFDAIGRIFFSSIEAPALTIGGRLESGAGVLSPPVFASRLLALSDSTSSYPTEVAVQLTGETRVDGEVAVWDEPNECLRYEVSPGSTPLNGVPLNASGGYDFTVVYSALTRQVTLTPYGASFDVWTLGTKRTVTGEVELDAHANSTGGHFFYMDETGAFVTSTTAWDILKHAPIAYVYYNATLAAGVLFEERHTAMRSLPWHKQAHEVYGTQLVSGFALSGYTLATDTTAGVTFGVASGVLADEDLRVTTSALADAGPYAIFERDSGGVWTWTTGNTLPYLYGATRPYANTFNSGSDAWERTEMGSAEYLNYWLFALPTPTATFQNILVPGQALHASLALAQAESVASLSWGTMPFQEIAPVAKIILRTAPSYSSTTKKARIEQIDRIFGTRASITASLSPGSHGALSGRSDADSHPASAITFTPTGTIASTNLQDALAEVASEATGGGSLTVKDFSGSPSYAGITTLEARGLTVSLTSAGVARLAATASTPDFLLVQIFS